MRIRSTKPEFWRSKTIASIDWEARLVLKGLESYVDDNGVGKDEVVIICADVFPHDLAADAPGTLRRVAGALLKLAEANLIVRYEIDGEPLIYVRRWKAFQRIDKPSQGRYPRPDGSMNYGQPVDESIAADQAPVAVAEARRNREDAGSPTEDSGSPPEICAPGTEEQRNRGTEEQNPTPDGVGGADKSAAKPKARGTRLPADWIPDPGVIEAMREECPTVDLKAEHRKFTDHWAAASGANAAKRDWNAAWRNWIRRAAEKYPSGNQAAGRPPAATRKVAAGMDLISRLGGSDPSEPNQFALESR